MRRALFITTVDFSKIKNGGALYSQYLFDLLGASSKIDAVILREHNTRSVKFAILLICALWNSLWHGVSLNVSYYNILGKIYLKRSRLNFSDYDMVVFDHVECFSLFDRSFRGTNILISHNIESKIMFERFSRFKFLQKLLFDEKTMEAFEEVAFSEADCIICISASDKKYIQKFNKNVFQILPIVIDSEKRSTKIAGGISFGFIGSFSWRPNVEAANQIISTYKHLFWKGDTLSVAGRGWELFNWAHVNVKLLGFVDNLGVFYGNLDFLVCPIISGGGVPIKVLEALNHGVPVITTRRVVDAIFSSEIKNYNHFGIYLMDDFIKQRSKMEGFLVSSIETIKDDRIGFQEFYYAQY